MTVQRHHARESTPKAIRTLLVTDCEQLRNRVAHGLRQNPIFADLTLSNTCSLTWGTSEPPFEVIVVEVSEDPSTYSDRLARCLDHSPNASLLTLSKSDSLEVELGSIRNGAQEHIVESTLTDSRLDQAIQHARERSSLFQKMRDEQKRVFDTRQSKLFRNLGHDLRSPLSAILGYADILSEERERLSEGEIDQAINGVRSNGEQILHVVDDLCELSQVGQPTVAVRGSFCCIRKSIQEAIEFARLRNDRLEVVLVPTSLNELPSEALLDANRLKQVITNLLLAVANTGCSDGNEPQQLNLGCRFEEHSPYSGVLRLSATSKVTQARLNTTPSRFGRQGLESELLVAQKIAELMGGEVSGELDEQGTIATCFVLPVAQRPPSAKSSSTGNETAASAQRRADLPRLEGLRVLLADDGVDNQRVITRFLSLAGATVETAVHGLEACEKFESTVGTHDEFDVVIMDMQMPVMDGHEATLRLRATYPDLPILALTAHATQDDRKLSLEAGCNAFLTKPVARPDLIRRLSDFHAPCSNPI